MRIPLGQEQTDSNSIETAKTSRLRELAFCFHTPDTPSASLACPRRTAPTRATATQRIRVATTSMGHTRTYSISTVS